MKIKNIILTTIIAASTIFTGCGNDKGDTGASSEEVKKVVNNGNKIVVGLDDEFPPMGFRDEKNEITGFDVDLAKAAAKRLGREVEFKAIDWSSKEAELKSGRIDILWNGLDITPEREENMLFSEPYMENRQVVFVRHTNVPTRISEETSLAGMIIGTQSASTTEEYINSNTELKDSLKEFKTYGDFTSAFMDLENGRIDAVVGDEIVGRYYMSKHTGQIEIINVAIGPISQFGIAFRKDDTTLREEVQKAFDEMIADGEAKKISEQWFGADLIIKR